MPAPLAKGAALVFIVLVARAPVVHGQQPLQFSGLAYVDYSYVLAAPIDEEEGDNGFGYRRVYLTGDYALSEQFSGRVRLEARDNSTTAEGRPAPFVKDLYVAWSNVWGEEHELVVGISPPPSFTVSEKLWGYRSLSATLMDRTDVVSSRDFGVAVRGPLAAGGAIRYGVMVGNNSGVRGESDEEKRVYGQVELYPAEQLTVTIGADYAGYDDERSSGATFNAFAGYHTAPFRVGVEGFFNWIALAEGDQTDAVRGVAVFAAVQPATQWELVARVDQVAFDLANVTTYETFIVVGVAYRPHPNIRFIPNVLVTDRSVDDQAHVTGRVTLYVTF